MVYLLDLFGTHKYLHEEKSRSTVKRSIRFAMPAKGRHP
jgi:hypothetical protein